MNVAVGEDGRLRVDTLATCFRPTPDSGAVVVDLSRAHFVEPIGLTGIAAVLDDAVTRGASVEFQSPRDLNCGRYLRRMRLDDVLESLSIRHALPSVRAEAINDGLSELKRFDSERDLEQVAATLIRQFAGDSRAVAQPLYDALYELNVNAVEHSGKGAGFVALQRFPRSNDVAFSVADSGIGIRDRLRQTRAVPTDGAAIVLAGHKYLASSQGAGRGRGITGVIELTGRHHGTLDFVTGSAHGKFTRGHWDRRVDRIPGRFPGTLTQTRFRFGEEA